VAVIGRRATAWSDAERVLCVRLDGMGDLVMTGPAIRALAASGPPDRRITVLTSPGAAAMAELLPGVDDVIAFRAPWVAGGADVSDDELAMLASIRARAFDAAAIFTVSTQSALPAALFCYLAGIPLRVAHARENAYRLLTDRVEEPEVDGATRHEVRRQLDLVAAVGDGFDGDDLRIGVPAEAFARGLERLRDAGVRDERWLAIHPGASAPSRRYPPELFARAADDLRDEGWGIALIGGPGDDRELRATADAMRSGAPILRGLSAAELAAVIGLAPVIVTNNSAPAHIAAAMRTPVVDLYALTNLQHAPWGVPHRLLFHDVPCRDCRRSVCPEGHHACLRLVPPSAIVEAVASLTAPPSGVAPTPERVGVGG
jgi:ADP-heptose:LPS heptosyltransferase